MCIAKAAQPNRQLEAAQLETLRTRSGMPGDWLLFLSAFAGRPELSLCATAAEVRNE